MGSSFVVLEDEYEKVKILNLIYYF